MVKMVAGGHLAESRFGSGREGTQTVGLEGLPPCLGPRGREQAGLSYQNLTWRPPLSGVPYHHTLPGRLESTLWVLLLTSALVHKACHHKNPPKDQGRTL